MCENSLAPPNTESPETGGWPETFRRRWRKPHRRAGQRAAAPGRRPWISRCAENDRRSAAAGNAQRQGGHHGAAGGRVVGTFGPGDPFQHPRSELFRVLGKALGLVVADERRHRAPLGRQDADEGADDRRPQQGALDVLDVLPGGEQSGDLLVQLDLLDPLFGLTKHLGGREQPDHDRDEIDAVHEFGKPEIVAANTP